MADERTTSHAKTVQLSSYQQNVLDRQAAISARYNDAAQGREQVQAREGQGDAQGRQSHQPTAAPQLRPDGAMAKGADAQAFEQRQSAEAANAEARRKALLERNQRAKDASQGRDGVELKNDGREK